MDAAFPEIEALAAMCRFKDCTHSNEPGCAVREAMESGTIAADRVGAWQKLRRELEFLERRQKPLSEAAERARGKSLSRMFKARLREGRYHDLE